MIDEFCWLSWFSIGLPCERSADRTPGLANSNKIIDQKLPSLLKHQQLSMLVVSDKDDKLCETKTKKKNKTMQCLQRWTLVWESKYTKGSFLSKLYTVV